MISDFIRHFLVILLFGVIVSLFPIFKIQDTGVTLSLFLAPVVAGANFIAGMYLIQKGFYAAQATFMKMVFGGMGIRLLVLGAIVATVNACEKLSFLAFLIALLGYYVVLMFLEIWFVHTRLMNGEESVRNETE